MTTETTSAQLPATIKIEIEKPPDGGYVVRVGDRYEDGLCMGEMLEVLIGVITKKDHIPYLRTREQHEAWDRKYRRTEEQASSHARLLDDLRAKNDESSWPNVKIENPPYEPVPPSLRWKWVSAGKWEAASDECPPSMYRIEMIGDRFSCGSSDPSLVNIDVPTEFRELSLAMAWCERNDVQSFADVPF